MKNPAKNMKRLFSIILLSALTLASCGEAADGAEKEKPPAGNPAEEGVSEPAAAAEDTPAEDTPQTSGIEAIDSGGRDYVILNVKTTENYNGHPYPEFTSEEQNGEPLNDAVYARNLAISEKYNLRLVSLESDNVAGDAKKMILAGDGGADLVCPIIADGFPLASQGLLQEMNSLPVVDYSTPYWMQYVRSDTSIEGKNYYLSGMMDISTLNGVGIAYMNKKLAQDYGIGMMYETVRGGKWTYDAVLSASSKVKEDLDGDGVFGAEDRVGIDCSSFAWQPFFYGSGNLFIKKDGSDIPYFDDADESMYNALVKVIELLNNDDTTLNVNHVKTNEDLGGLTVRRFREDKALFFIELIYGVPPLRDMDSDFSLLPMPKADESQKDYSTYIHVGKATAMAVPVTVSGEGLTLAGSILGDLAFESAKTIQPVFYDLMLKTKFSRDAESSEMLDIIYSNIRTDIALAMMNAGINIDGELRSACTAGDTAVVSKLTANKEKYDNTLTKLVEELKGR